MQQFASSSHAPCWPSSSNGSDYRVIVFQNRILSNGLLVCMNVGSRKHFPYWHLVVPKCFYGFIAAPMLDAISDNFLKVMKVAAV